MAREEVTQPRREAFVHALIACRDLAHTLDHRRTGLATGSDQRNSFRGPSSASFEQRDLFARWRRFVEAGGAVGRQSVLRHRFPPIRMASWASLRTKVRELKATGHIGNHRLKSANVLEIQEINRTLSISLSDAHSRQLARLGTHWRWRTVIVSICSARVAFPLLCWVADPTGVRRFGSHSHGCHWSNG